MSSLGGPPAINQFVAGFSNGDAISNEARVMQRIFTSWGHPSRIFSEGRRILPDLRRHCGDAQAYAAEARPEDIALLHLSIGSPVNDIFATLPCRKAILYHNITPAHYFQVINPQTAFELARGRQQIEALRGVAQVNMADSHFNARELEALGYADCQVLPLVLNLPDLTGDLDRRALREFGDGRTNILFVGRLAPNKRIEDLVSAYAVYRAAVDPDARLVHVGSFAGVEPYFRLCQAQARDMQVSDGIHFLGAVPQATLNACYATATVFLSMSDHEGFCIPVLEAMVHGIPVLAHAAGAVPETLDGAGVLFHEKEFESIAEMVARLATDTRLRSAVVAAQEARIQRYRDRDLAGELRTHLAPLLTTTT